MIIYYFDQKQDWTLDEIYVACEVPKKALNIIHGIEALLTTQELRQQFMARVPIYPTSIQVFTLLKHFRREQLELNPMSDEDFRYMFLLNPLKALTQYFKELVSPVCVERMRTYGVTIEHLIEQRKLNRHIHVVRAIGNVSHN
ncbi:hypothetical protein C0Q44_15640 [Paenibacillus sp. PCH8]|uniref:hypothetical protein n=1 Tax=Paenibacillus sp. PCH8 TaxID=2066524 RepID=UPI000CF86456|nr:hypothetical protein [Paenibacillus sp. PCH8]PQP82816.1 hypothetical protein C0Q44_15640 [Paenibacillus sp. PCH8]